MSCNTIDFVRRLGAGACTCEYNMGSLSINTDEKGNRTSKFDRGPRTHHCIRCRAREALATDGITQAGCEFTTTDSSDYQLG